MKDEKGKKKKQKAKKNKKKIVARFFTDVAQNSLSR